MGCSTTRLNIVHTYNRRQSTACCSETMHRLDTRSGPKRLFFLFCETKLSIPFLFVSKLICLLIFFWSFSSRSFFDIFFFVFLICDGGIGIHIKYINFWSIDFHYTHFWDVVFCFFFFFSLDKFFKFSNDDLGRMHSRRELMKTFRFFVFWSHLIFCWIFFLLIEWTLQWHSEQLMLTADFVGE